MKFKYSIAITGFAIALIVLSALLSANRFQGAYQRQPLLPELSAIPKPSVTQVQLLSAGNRLIVDAVKQGDQWLMANHFNYPINKSEVTTLIESLSLGVLLERKTADPEKYHFLSVDEVSLPSAQGYQLNVFADLFKKQLVIGQHAKLGKGQYVRRGKQSYLMDRKIDLPANKQDWLSKTIISLEQSALLRLSYQQSTNEQFTIEKAQSDNTYVLKSVNGRTDGLPTLKYRSVLSSLPLVFSELQLVDVTPIDAAFWQADDRTNPVFTVVVNLVDGSKFEAQLKKESGKYWLRINIKTVAIGNNYLRERQQFLSQWQYQITSFDYGQFSRSVSDFTR